ncbi:amino acid kinase family protein [Aeoliella mucimassa]|uniref:Amino acid kinase family protein n=1 Tax=Aeoliella mucimassa TaxID=2527972 RepID=A0A518AP59_9BACT|nr:hypothetical protein [Aeoliella mucimassa]QDU56502.1 Amino acid kinase family protein [Aeoliella mucimassa]
MIVNPALEVVKLGGSLLARPDLVPAVRAWLADNQDRPVVFVVGGGSLVDHLREVCRTMPVDDHTAHWLAIDAMELSAHWLAWRIPELATVAHYDKAAAIKDTCRTSVMLCGLFLRENEPLLPGTRLPIGWQVTSDSIAARLAVCLGASRLTLIKSRAATAAESTDWHQATRSGLVDAFFPSLVGELTEVRVVTI